MRAIEIRAGLFAVVAALAVTSTGWAQSITQNAVPPTDAKKAMAAEAAAGRRPAAPAGLPGAHDDRGGAAPASEIASAMTPDDALFDAVNRGDVPAARAALARGADVDGRNILGLTPVELAVDLGRNDMTFLLLSLRSAGSPVRAQKVATVTAPATKPVRAEVPAAARSVVSKPTPVRYTGDPGTPAPAAGFLGFGGTSQ